MVKRHPLVAFFVLAYALSWALWVPLIMLGNTVAPAVGLVLLLLGSLVPSTVAVVLTAMTGGREAVRALLGRFLVRPLRPRWFLVLLVPTVIVLVAVTLNAVLFGGPAPALAVPLLVAVSMVAFSIFPGSATGEEIGWRGYALPRLQVGRSALTASLILGAIHGLWHLPLWLRGLPGQPIGLYLPFLIQALAWAVVYTWLFNSSNGSLLLAVLFHAATNAPLTLILAPLGAASLGPIFWMMTGLTALAAVLVIAVFGPADLSRRPRQRPRPAETGSAPIDVDPTAALPAQREE